jgi:hypothetical protein
MKSLRGIDNRLKLTALVGFCGGAAIVLCAVLAFRLVYLLFIPGNEQSMDIYGLFALLGLFIYGFIILFLLSSYMAFGLVGVITVWALSKHIKTVVDAMAFPLASGIIACATFFGVYVIFCILTGVYFNANSFDVSGFAFTLIISAILLFLPGLMIACASGVIVWVVARKSIPSIKA